jgi:4-hydroxy-2-oxoheptanedioate aldolase
MQLSMLYPQAVAAFQERARSRKVCIGVHHSAMSPQLLELYGHVGLDYVICSQEVESLDKYTLENCLRAADAARTVPVIKILRNDPLLIEEAMNSGAPMVMVPHVINRKQIDDALRASRFSMGGKGTRGLCPVSRYTGYGSGSMADAVRAANEGRNIIPIIEDVEALPNIEDMMSHPEVDIFEIGPFDLSQSMGLRPDLSYGNPPVMEAVEKIGALARKYKKGLIAPFWLPKDADSPSKVIQLQTEQLIKRGITIFYGIEVLMLTRIFRDWMPLREINAD